MAAPDAILDIVRDRKVVIQPGVDLTEAQLATTVRFASGAGGGVVPSTGGPFIALDADNRPIRASGTGADAALRSDLAAGGGAALTGFRSGATSAVSRSVQAKLRDMPINPLDFGAKGTGDTDDIGFLRKACDYAIETGKPLDLTTAPVCWLIGDRLDLTGVPMVMATFDKEIVADVTGPFAGGYAVTAGDPAQDYAGGRSDKFQLLGNLTVRASSRGRSLNGVYLKGSFMNIGAIRVSGFAGRGVCGDSVWDGTIARLSIELCGRQDEWALFLGSNGDTFNATKIGSIQVEQAYHKAIYANLLRCRIENIHSERLTILTADEGNGSYENFYFLLSNSSLDQAVLHARSINAPDVANRTGPSGEPLARLADGSAAPPRITMNGDASRFSEIEVNGAVVTTTYGTGLAISNLAALDYRQTAPSNRVLLTLPSIARTCEIAADTTVIEPMIKMFIPAFNAKNIIVSGGWINDPISFPNNILGNIVFNNVTLSGVGDTRSPASGYLPVTFSDCAIGTLAGSFGALAKIKGGRIGAVALVSRAVVEIDGTVADTFGHTGDAAYITRGVRAATVNSWSFPTNAAYPAGTVTERVGYSAAGKFYQQTGPNGTTWAVVGGA